MSIDFSDFLDVLDENVFEEVPVTPEEFVQSKDYLGLPVLSEEQYRLLKASTQILRKETLYDILPQKKLKNDGLKPLMKSCACWARVRPLPIHLSMTQI